MQAKAILNESSSIVSSSIFNSYALLKFPRYLKRKKSHDVFKSNSSYIFTAHIVHTRLSFFGGVYLTKEKSVNVSELRGL